MGLHPRVARWVAWQSKPYFTFKYQQSLPDLSSRKPDALEKFNITSAIRCEQKSRAISEFIKTNTAHNIDPGQRYEWLWMYTLEQTTNILPPLWMYALLAYGTLLKSCHALLWTLLWFTIWAILVLAFISGNKGDRIDYKDKPVTNRYIN